MESHSYEIDGGATTDPRPDSVVPSKAKRRAKTTCQHLSPKGRHCRMLPTVNSKFCKVHESDAEPTTDEVASQLLGSIPSLNTAPNVNRFLGNLVRQFALKRIERRDAITFAYLGQLLLNSLAALDRQAKIEADIESKIPPEIIIDIPRPDYSKYFQEPSGDTTASSNTSPAPPATSPTPTPPPPKSPWETPWRPDAAKY